MFKSSYHEMVRFTPKYSISIIMLFNNVDCIVVVTIIADAYSQLYYHCRLGENYEDTPGGCLPRSVLYTHYQDFCKRNQLEPSSAASFGKVRKLMQYIVQNARMIQVLNESLDQLLVCTNPKLFILYHVLGLDNCQSCHQWPLATNSLSVVMMIKASLVSGLGLLATATQLLISLHYTITDNPAQVP